MKPKSTKFKKYHKPYLKNYYNYKTNLIYSEYALVTTEPSLITASQLESITLTIKRALKRKGKIIHRVFPHQSLTKKPQEVRMGKGKGNIEYYACRVKPGRIIFEVDGVTEEIAKIALYKASAKLPIKTKFIKR